MSVSDRLVPLDELEPFDDEWPRLPGEPPVAPVAHVFTSEVIFDEPVADPHDAADWCRILRRTGEGRGAAFLLDPWRNVAAAWFSDHAQPEALLSLALSADIRELAGRELVLVTVVDCVGPSTPGDRQRLRALVKRAKRRNAILLDWVVGDGARARSLRLATDPGNGWPPVPAR